jgi:hypothetical protein
MDFLSMSEIRQALEDEANMEAEGPLEGEAESSMEPPPPNGVESEEEEEELTEAPPPPPIVSLNPRSQP